MAQLRTYSINLQLTEAQKTQANNVITILENKLPKLFEFYDKLTPAQQIIFKQKNPLIARLLNLFNK